MERLVKKAQAIQLLALDVDGVLTDGTIYYSDGGREVKGFHTLDGLGIKLLQKSGIAVAIISGKHSGGIKERAQELGIEHLYLGNDKKLSAYENLKSKTQLQDTAIAYMGDDLTDLCLLNRVGFAITVPESPIADNQCIDYITKRKAGNGAVREVCDFIMKAQGKNESVLQSYLSALDDTIILP